MGEITRYIKSSKGISELKEMLTQHFVQQAGGDIADETDSGFSIVNGKNGLNHPDYLDLTVRVEVGTLANVGLNRYEIKCDVHQKASSTFWAYFAVGFFLYPIAWPVLGIQYWNIDPDTLYTNIIDKCMEKIKIME